MALSHVLVSPIADFTGTVTVFNSAGATVTANATEIVRPSDWNSAHNQFVTLAGNTSGASTMSGTNIVYQGGNNVTLSANGQTIIFSGPNTAAQSVQPAVNLAAGTQTATSGTIVFSNSNGITFGMSGSTQVTASYNSTQFAGTGTTITGGAAITLNSAGLQFNGASLAGTSTGSAGANVGISMTHNSAGLNLSVTTPAAVAQTVQPVAVSNSAGSFLFSTLNFSNANGVTFGTSAGNIVTASVAAAGGAQTAISGIIVSDATYTSGSVYFSAQANVTLNSSVNGASQYVRISGVAAQTTQPVAWSGSGGSSAFSTLNFSNASNISFSNSNGSIQVVHNLAGTSTGSAGANVGISMTHNSSGLNLSITTPATVAQTNQTGGIYFTAQTTGQSSSSTYDLRTLSVVGDGIVSAGWSNGTVRISATQSNQAVSNSAGSFTFQTLNFSNANNVTFGTSAGGIITASVAAGGGAAISGGANSQNTGTVNFANSNNVTFGLSNNGTMTASVALAASNSAGSFTFGTLNFSNANNVTFGTSAGGVITASVAAPGAAAENNWVHLLGANTAGSTTASGSTVGFSGVNMTLSGTNNSQVVFSVPATSSLVGTSGLSISSNGSTISVYQAPLDGFHPYGQAPHIIGVPGQHSIAFAPIFAERPFKFDRVVIPVLFSNATNSSNSWSLTISVGIFSRNVSSLSLITSTVGSASGTASGTVGNYSIWGGPKLLTIPMTTTIFASELFIGVWSKTSANAGGQTLNLYLASQNNSNFSGIVGVASATSQQMKLGLGHYSATFSSAMPNAFSFNQLQGTASLQQRPVALYFASQTA